MTSPLDCQKRFALSIMDSLGLDTTNVVGVSIESNVGQMPVAVIRRQITLAEMERFCQQVGFPMDDEAFWEIRQRRMSVKRWFRDGGSGDLADYGITREDVKQYGPEFGYNPKS